MKIHGHDIAVCSWSLQPQGMQDLAEKVRTLGLDRVQLSLGKLIELDDKRKYQELGHLRAAGIQFAGGMIGFAGENYASIPDIRRTGGFLPDDEWTLRRRLAKESARLAQELGMKLIGTHVGFVPPPGAAGYSTMRDRVRAVAEDFSRFGIELVMETGQEPAAELLEFLHDLAMPNVGISFDPANMILYGAGDPIEAIRLLGPYIHHVHVKDATPSPQPGETWGEEVPFGRGQVNPRAFLDALKQVNYMGPLAIEREAGNDRMGDVKIAIQSLQSA